MLLEMPQVLKCPGSVDHGHQLSFQLSSDLPESTPSVPLSWTMASQYTNPANVNAPILQLFEYSHHLNWCWQSQRLITNQLDN